MADSSSLNEAPVYTSSTTATVNENQTAAYMTVATDRDGDALTYRLEGTDALFFDISVVATNCCVHAGWRTLFYDKKLPG